MAETLVVTRTFRASIEQVYDAWTNPGRMAQWFFAGPGWTADVEADARTGGAFHIVMHPPDGPPLESHGTFVELVPPRRIRLRWNSYAVSNTTVILEFDPVPEGTQLRLTHTDLPSAEVSARHSGGWGATLDNLERELAA